MEWDKHIMQWDKAIEMLQVGAELDQRDRDTIAGMLEHGKKAMLGLESLTAQGSEFYNDIEACVRYVKLQRSDCMEHVKIVVKENKKLKNSQH